MLVSVYSVFHIISNTVLLLNHSQSEVYQLLVLLQNLKLMMLEGLVHHMAWTVTNTWLLTMVS